MFLLYNYVEVVKLGGSLGCFILFGTNAALKANLEAAKAIASK